MPYVVRGVMALERANGAVVPYGVSLGFSLAFEARAVAAHYGCSAQDLRAGVGDVGREARRALMWHLVRRRRISAERVAAMLNVSSRSVRDGVAAHEDEIEQFRAALVG